MDQHKSASTVLSFALLLSLAGCGGVPGGPAPAASPAPDAQTPEAATAQTAVQPFALDGTLTGAGVHSGYGNQDGFYTVRYAADGTANVMFVDYAAGVETCLCASPNCTHDSEACTSWCGCPANIPDVFPAGDRLVWVYLGNPEYVDEYGDAARCKIEVSRLDGSDRKTAAVLDPRLQLVYGSIGVGENAVAALVSALQDGSEQLEETWQLLLIPLDGGEIQTVAEFSADDFSVLELAGGGDGVIHLVKTQPSEDFKKRLEDLRNGTATPDPETGVGFDSAEAIASNVSQIVSVHGNGSFVETEVRWKSVAGSYQVIGNRMILLESDTEGLTLRDIDLASGEEQARKVLLPPVEVPFAEYTNRLSLCAVTDDWLIVRNSFSDHSSPQTVQQLLAIRRQTGEVTQLPDWSAALGGDWLPAAATADYLLLMQKGGTQFFVAGLPQALAQQGTPKAVRKVSP